MKNYILTLSFILLITIHAVSTFAQENRNLFLGNPSNATSDTTNADNYLMEKPQYSISYNNSKHIPNWVSWYIRSMDLGKTKRMNDFRPDFSLPISFYHVSPSDYAGTGFDKGHQCPSGDRTNSNENNSATFLMTNMIPQAPNNNRITWEHLESYCRKLVGQGNELYIICGSIGNGGEGKKGTASVIRHDVIVPSQIWKIVVVLTAGTTDIHQIDTLTRIVAVLIPNNQLCSQKEWFEYRVSVDNIEALTGYDFLSMIPQKIQKIIETKVDHQQID